MQARLCLFFVLYGYTALKGWSHGKAERRNITGIAAGDDGAGAIGIKGFINDQSPSRSTSEMGDSPSPGH
jgi:hypothetical protein